MGFGDSGRSSTHKLIVPNEFSSILGCVRFGPGHRSDFDLLLPLSLYYHRCQTHLQAPPPTLIHPPEDFANTRPLPQVRCLKVDTFISATTAESFFVGMISSLYYISKAFKKSDWFWYYVVGKWIEMIAVGESCFAGIHCCYVGSDAGEAFQQQALLLLKLPLKKRSTYITIVKKDIMKRLKVD